LAFTILITVSAGTIVKEYRNQSQKVLVSPLIAGLSTSQRNSPPTIVDPGYYAGWQTFVNNYYGYKIRHPSEVSVKNSRNGDVVLQKDKSVNISIAQKILSPTDSINTAVETDIDEKQQKINNDFTLMESISPVAIGSQTAYTFSSQEYDDQMSYFYLPQDQNKYLFIIVKSGGQGSYDFPLSEKIIYSIEYLH